MYFFETVLLVFCTVSFSPSEARGGRGGGGRSSSGGGWRSSGSSGSWGSSSGSSGTSWGSSSGSSGSPGSSWGSSSSFPSSSGSSWGSSSGSSGSPWSSSSGSSGSPWSSSSGSSGSHSDSPSPRRDNPFGLSQSPSRKQADSFDSPTSSIHRSTKPGMGINSRGDPFSGDHDGQYSVLSSVRFWRRRSWIPRSRSQSESVSNSDGGPEELFFGTDTTNETEGSDSTIYDIFPSCENLGEEMWRIYDDLQKSGEMNSDSCQGDDFEVCLQNVIEKVRCAVTEGMQQECMEKIMAFMRGGDVCNEANEETPTSI